MISVLGFYLNERGISFRTSPFLHFLSEFSYMHKICLFLLLALVPLAGCGPSGPPLAQVSGQVTLYGKPYAKGIVTFTPVDGGPAGISSTDQDGKYELYSSGNKGAVIGKHKVSITTIMEPDKATIQPSDLKSDDPRYAELMTNPDPYKKIAAKKEPIPAKYNSATELSFEVNSGSNKINIEMK
jgi:hypothetical protein